MRCLKSNAGRLVVVIALLTLVLCALCCADDDAQEPKLSGNLVGNGGFERSGVEDMPEGWMTRNWLGHPDVTGRRSGDARFGRHSLELKSEQSAILFGAYSQPLDVSAWAGKKLLLSVYYRTKGYPGADIAVMTFPEDFTENEWDTPALSHCDRRIENSNGWKRFSTTVDLLPNAHHAIVLVRITGAGQLWVDGVSLRALPAEIGVEVTEAGLVSSHSSRQTSLVATNHTRGEMDAKLRVEAWRDGDRKSSREKRINLSAGETRDISIDYNLDFRRAHDLRVTVLGPGDDVVLYEKIFEVPGLVDAYIAEPAFRQTILSDIPVSEITVRGRLHAVPDVQHATVIHGRLVGAMKDFDEQSAAMFCDREGRFAASIKPPTMVSGEYMMRLNAEYDGRDMEVKLPLRKAPPGGSQTGYTENGLFYANGQPVFPLCLGYFYQASDMEAAHEAGFNCVISPARMASKAFMDKASETGLGVFVSSANFEKDFWSNMIEKYTHRDTLWGWYILERPGSRIPAVAKEVLEAVYSDIAELDHHHPVLCGMDSEAALEDYSAASDLLIAWTHPSPPGNLSPVARIVEAAVREAKKQKPVWALVPIAGTTHIYNKSIDPEGLGRAPTPQEYRAMVYLSLIHGATGIVSYAYRIPGDTDRRGFVATQHAPEVWEMVAEVNRELQAVGPQLLSGTPQRKVEANTEPVVHQIWYHEGRAIVIIVNTTASAQVLRFNVNGLKEPRLRSINSPQRLDADERGFIVPLRPYEVGIYMGTLRGAQ
ncbi:MAG: hypothetical protein ACLFWB_08130 [Armatimonadota bacterium]